MTDLETIKNIEDSLGISLRLFRSATAFENELLRKPKLGRKLRIYCVDDDEFVIGIAIDNLDFKEMTASYVSRFRRIQTLSLTNCRIENCTPFGELSSLTKLSLSTIRISEYSFLKGMTSLTTLSLNGNQISDASFLKGMTSLKNLYLGGNQISDASFLKGMTSLKNLSIAGNQINDFSVLKGMTSLTYLSLGGNQISDASFLKGMTSLSYLNLNGNQISDASFLKGMTSLIDLNLTGNQISDYSFLTGMTYLTNLNLNGNQISDASFLKGLTSLTTLNLAGNQISDASFLKGMASLKNLSIAGNRINDFSVLKGMTSLTYLSLGGNQIGDASFLKGMTSLIDLNLNGNQIGDASFLKGMTSLIDLNLNGNQISDASFLKGMTSLTNLNLNGNQISDYSFLKGMTSLTNLNLNGNQISDASFLKGLTSLTYLSLGGNQISDALFLKGMTSLSYLNLNGNQISDASFLKGMTSLRYLNLTGNQISDYSFLKGMTSLTNLDLAGNQISDATFLQGMTSLTNLNLNGNQISDYSFLTGMTSLTNLDLAGNQISDATFLQGMTSLSYLNLNGNQISDASFIQGMISLTNLNLAGNQISDASFLKGMTSLTYLNLTGNQISDASFLKAMTSLTYLNLTGNQISDASFLKAMTSLRYLNLTGNQISDFSFLKCMTSLTYLNLIDNEVRDVLFLSGLDSLHSLDLPNISHLKLPKYLTGNPRLRSRQEIIELVDYFQQLDEGTDFIYEAKILIVGEPNSGKTTLFRKLQNPDYSPESASEEEKRETIGVNRVMWPIKLGNEKKEFKAHLWDFGGQEKQYVLHQYFFTEDSLYVLLVDDRREHGNLNYWFEVIATLGVGCPVIVVLNEINSLPIKNFDIGVYRKEFGEKINKIEERSVNFAKDGDGRFLNLSTEIRTNLANLEHIGNPLPETWVNIREELEKLEEPIISIDRFFEICEESKVHKKQYQYQILKYLHNLGIALNYKSDDNLRNKLILNPNWVIDAIYVVLKDHSIYENDGIFDSNQIFDLWETYKSEEKTVLLQLMLKGKFEIAYRMGQTNKYITPILLPEIERKFEFNESNSLQVQFRFIFKPKGFISRLIVRFNQNIDSQEEQQIVWKKGVLIKHKSSKALIIESEIRKTISINVSGNSGIENRELMTIIRTEINRIHLDWFEGRLEFQELMGCDCVVCKAAKRPHLYDLKIVESYYIQGLQLTCDKSVMAGNPQPVPPRRLLEGVFVEEHKVDLDGEDERSYNIAENLTIKAEVVSFVANSKGKVTVNQSPNSKMTEARLDRLLANLDERYDRRMEELAQEIVEFFGPKFEKLNSEQQEIFESLRSKSKYKAKLKLATPLFGLLGVGFQIEREITPDEFIDLVRKTLHEPELQKLLPSDSRA